MFSGAESIAAKHLQVSLKDSEKLLFGIMFKVRDKGQRTLLLKFITCNGLELALTFLKCIHHRVGRERLFCDCYAKIISVYSKLKKKSQALSYKY